MLIHKKLVGLHAFTYTERLELLGPKRLESKSITADVLFAYKLLFGLTALHSDNFIILRKSTCTRGHPHKLFLPRCSTDVRKYFFSQCIVKLWNELPANTDFSSIESFKRTLDGFNFNAYCHI